MIEVLSVVATLDLIPKTRAVVLRRKVNNRVNLNPAFLNQVMIRVSTVTTVVLYGQLGTAGFEQV